MQMHRLYYNKKNSIHYLSHDTRNAAFLKCRIKCADQLRNNQTASQHLCFSYMNMNSTIPLLPDNSKKSSLKPSSLVVHPGLCLILLEISQTCFRLTWSKTEKVTLFILK